MITKDEILKMVAKIGRHNRGVKTRELINPDREWSLAIAAFIVLLLVGFWYNVTLFSYYNNIEDNLVNETVSTPRYNYGTLTEVLEKYDARKQQFDEIRAGIVPVPEVVPVEDKVIIIENPVVETEVVEDSEEPVPEVSEVPSAEPIEEEGESDEPLVF